MGFITEDITLRCDRFPTHGALPASASVRFFVQYSTIRPISYHINLGPRSKPIIVLSAGLCDAAVLAFRCLKHWIVKCTGLYCFADFCFHRSFIKVIFHCAAFPPVVGFLAPLCVWDGVHVCPRGAATWMLILISDQNIVYFLPGVF